MPIPFLLEILIHTIYILKIVSICGLYVEWYLDFNRRVRWVKSKDSPGSNLWSSGTSVALVNKTLRIPAKTQVSFGSMDFYWDTYKLSHFSNQIGWGICFNIQLGIIVSFMLSSSTIYGIEIFWSCISSRPFLSECSLQVRYLLLILSFNRSILHWIRIQPFLLY